MQDVLAVALLCINAYFLATVLANVYYLHSATSAPRVRRGMFVSVIVPARDEQDSIEPCLASLLAQDYLDYEVVVVDDESTDRTAAIVARMSAHDTRLRLVRGAPVPDGWLGKPHALAQGAEASRGDVLVLTDADTVHAPDSLSWAVTNLVDHRADVVSGYLTQEYGTWGEKLIVPTMYAMMLLLPLALLPRTKSPKLAFAIGQYVAVRREALDAVGGYESIKSSIVDDMAMAARMKTFGFRNVFLDAKEIAHCRLYSGYRDAFDGIKRSFYAAVGGTLPTAFVLTLIVLGVIAFPAAAVLVSYARLQTPAAPLAGSVVLFAIAWALVTWDRDVPLLAFVAYPLVFLNLLALLVASVATTGFGRGVRWKGRLVRIVRESGAARAARLAELASRLGRGR